MGYVCVFFSRLDSLAVSRLWSLILYIANDFERNAKEWTRENVSHYLVRYLNATDCDSVLVNSLIERSIQQVDTLQMKVRDIPAVN